MHTDSTDSNAIPLCRWSWASAVGGLALLCFGLFQLDCAAADFADNEFAANFRSPHDDGKISIGNPEFRSPTSAANQNATAEVLTLDPFEFQSSTEKLNAKLVSTKQFAKMNAEVSTWTAKPMTALGTDIALSGGEVPDEDVHNEAGLDCPLCDCFCNRGWPGLCYCFAATGLYYNPLYFEEANLERYGYGCTPCLQSAVSAAHFFGHVPLLPYMMATDCPGSCNYAVGHYRPGSCAPWRQCCLSIY